MNTSAAHIRKSLVELSDTKTQQTGLRFFKEPILIHGVKSKDVKKIAAALCKQLKGQPKEAIFELSQELFSSLYLEQCAIACSLCEKNGNLYCEQDIDIFEKWIDKYVSNWASCDTFCNHTIGDLVSKYPSLSSRLITWAHSENLWLRRAAAVSLIVPAKKGLFLPQVFQIADILLTDKEDMVQKGYGWMLKVASHAHQKEVFDYVMANKATMPRTALRYAIEKMPSELRSQAMAR